MKNLCGNLVGNSQKFRLSLKSLLLAKVGRSLLRILGTYPYTYMYDAPNDRI